ncbi:MAG: Holliday junction resolvase RuvX [Candidatus Magasanikbacteria bacterium CG11_big_fil_rev_8_21_14_0_20_39_34]|uniref:Putative pre-16S rRNA nuclease n=1 Tax=Candidatus Magasanikbacteria bacterium CG11_big_fil_rev_8_21_14_0_20_39_34 TaxID=1974653 RepID=A0A2H0N630_9BACT|nr:MAG: Holliday junction resolvase RuvX [Candidatus Magasanikbacteria bacterium CG11_big_fil_rev_8_21_14_0_20_39_34]
MNILAIDFGTKNLGLAWCSEGLDLILPYGRIQTQNPEQRDQELIALVKNERIEKVVVGLPLGMQGEENVNTERIRNFVEHLKKQLDIEFDFVDERFTTQQASNTAGDISSDEKSAMIILETYLQKAKDS